MSGTIHVANRGTASWHQVGEYLTGRLPDAPAQEPVPLGAWGFCGGRPVDSTLNTDRLAELGWTMPTWQDAVDRFLLSLAQGARR